MILLFGPAGSGKSTQGEVLAKKHGFKLIIMGDLLREAAKTNEKIARSIRTGVIAPYKVANEIIYKEIDKNDPKKIIIDGFPRAQGQAKKFISRYGLDKITAVIEIDLNQKESLKRLLLRGRQDDLSAEVVRKRLEIYHKETMKILKQFRKNKVKILKIDGSGSIERVTGEIEEKLNLVDR